MSETILEMNHIIKRFPGTVALNDVSIDLKKGEILAIVGENGAGKSTLMKILSGSYPCDSYEGEIVVRGEIKKFYSPKDAEKAGIEMIYQEISSHLDLSIAENIYIGSWPVKAKGIVDWNKVYQEAQKYIDLVGLKVSSRTTVRSLNTSQQQLVAIARALSKNPNVLVLDEPTSALTEGEANTLFANLKELRNTGISCIYISHKMKEVMEIADRVTVLRDGCHIVTTDKTGTDMNRIVENMVGRKIGNMFPKEKVEVGEEIFRVENLTVPHPYSANKNIVENISFSLKKGEILGIAGLVGSGRSETVNSIFGSYKRKSGKIMLDGREIGNGSPREAVRNGIGLLTEDRKKTGYIWTMDVKQNISVACLKKISRRYLLQMGKEKEFAKHFIEKLKIKVNNEKTSIMSLSGGNQQKVVLAKWLMNDLKVLMLDEPTRGIDVGAKVQIYNIMVDLAKQGIAIIMISSELPELLAMCDRFIVLADGVVKTEFMQSEASEEVFMKAATGI